MGESAGDILKVCTEMGRILLENGAEIFRTEDTLSRVARYYGIEDENFFVLTNGILSSAVDREGNTSARVRFIPSNSANLAKVNEINQLSREICSGKYTLDEVRRELVRIDSLHSEPSPLIIGATALGSGAFSLLYGAAFADALVALLAGFILGLFSELVAKKHLTKITKNITGAALVTAICLIFHHRGIGANMNAMIAGAIIPLIPGVSFVNGIRDIAHSDYISGVVRLMDSLFVFICIAIGVGTSLAFYSRFLGGLSL